MEQIVKLFYQLPTYVQCYSNISKYLMQMYSQGRHSTKPIQKRFEEYDPHELAGRAHHSKMEKIRGKGGFKAF